MGHVDPGQGLDDWPKSVKSARMKRTLLCGDGTRSKFRFITVRPMASAP
jgi:hypothetical protein